MLSKVKLPPSFSERFFAVVNPRPFPCISRFPESSIVYSLSNTFDANSLTIPFPLSTASIHTLSLSWRKRRPNISRHCYNEWHLKLNYTKYAALHPNLRAHILPFPKSPIPPENLFQQDLITLQTFSLHILQILIF